MKPKFDLDTFMGIFQILVVAGLVLFLVLTCRAAGAATITGSFTLPVAYTDESALSLSAIQRVLVQVGTCNGTKFGAMEASVGIKAPKTTYSITSPRAAGQFCVRARTRLYTGEVSAWSLAAIKTI